MSDTHGYMPLKAVEALEGCDHILHAGDVGTLSILNELETIAPVTAVQGNNDYPLAHMLKQHELVELEGVRFLITHRLEDMEYLLSHWQAHKPLPHVGIYGHTHVPRDFIFKLGGLRMMNPGSLYGPRGGSTKSLLLLEVTRGALLEATAVSL